MKIGIVGLGLMGGSIAVKLKNAHEITAFDHNPEALSYALEKGIVHHATSDIAAFFGNVELVYLCLYPGSVAAFVKEHQRLAKPGTVWIDIAGVKRPLIAEIVPILRSDLDFVFTHPIAGREKIGVWNALGSIFEGANYIITPIESNLVASLDLATALAKELGVRTITRVDADVHDDAIAYTSQLTHVLSLALVESDDEHHDLSQFIGDSYRDLTRIAMINEPLWSELFLSNQTNLLDKIDRFQETLSHYRDAIASGDKAALEAHMQSAKQKRRKIERG